MTRELEPAVRGRASRASTWLVRSWFGAVGAVIFFLAGLIVYDIANGEGVAHLGLPVFLEVAALIVVGVAVALLPLLVIAVILDRRGRA